MKKQSVLAENPLDLILGSREKSAPTAPSEPATSSVVAIDAAKRAAVPVPADLAAERTPAAPAVIEAKAAPVQPAARAEGPISDVGPRPEARPEADASSTRRNRIGTLQQPYLRKKDGVETRQASVTLPIDTLRKLGHCSVDTGMKTSELMRQAIEEFLQSRGY
jgi:hypothetical protein